jgi:hypothetical protein
LTAFRRFSGFGGEDITVPNAEAIRHVRRHPAGWILTIEPASIIIWLAPVLLGYFPVLAYLSRLTAPWTRITPAGDHDDNVAALLTHFASG